MAGESDVVHSQKESCVALEIVVGDTSKAAKKGSRGRDKSVSGEPMAELEKRLARVALKVAEHQERWEEHNSTVTGIVKACMEQFREELLGAIQEVRDDMLLALNEAVDRNNKANEGNASLLTTLQADIESLREELRVVRAEARGLKARVDALG
ncbi:unnamed protein product [Amaranthus hypochondriacus]